MVAGPPYAVSKYLVPKLNGENSSRFSGELKRNNSQDEVNPLLNKNHT